MPGVDPTLLDPRATWADPDAYDAQGGGARRDVPRELHALRRRRARRGSGRPSRLAGAPFLRTVHTRAAIRVGWRTRPCGGSPFSSRGCSLLVALALAPSREPGQPATSAARARGGRDSPAQREPARRAPRRRSTAVRPRRRRARPSMCSSPTRSRSRRQRPKAGPSSSRTSSHGPELAQLQAYIVTFDEVQEICGTRALGCYARDQLVAPGEAAFDTSAEEVVQARVRPPRRGAPTERPVGGDRLGAEALGERGERLRSGHAEGGVPRRRGLELPAEPR